MTPDVIARLAIALRALGEAPDIIAPYKEWHSYAARLVEMAKRHGLRIELASIKP